MKYLNIFLSLVFLWLFSHVAFATTATLTWEAPTHRENGLQIEQGELVAYELQHTFIPLDPLEEPVWSDSLELSHDTTTHITSEFELSEGAVGMMWRIRAKDSEAIYSIWADSVRMIPHSPIQKMIFNIVNNAGSITINID